MAEPSRINKNRAEQIAEWEKEIEKRGFLRNEGSLLSHLKSIEEQKDPKLLSHLLTLAALSRTGRTKPDNLSLSWMEKAVELDPENERAKKYIAGHEWKSNWDLFRLLTFPPLRETDNQQAKKKTAEQYIAISRQFLIKTEEPLRQLETRLKEAEEINAEKLAEVYRKLVQLLSTAVEETASLLKAAQEYEQSITGLFYNSAHYGDMKARLQKLADLTAAWEKQFAGEEQDPKESKNPLAELNKMVGLESVKGRINDFYQFLKYQNKRKSLGFQTKDELSLNMILTGNPGTGKTTLARLFAQIYHELNVLPREEVIETDRSQLVGAYVGQTEENVRAIVERSLGGVLFIDEAYSLKREGQTGNDYGQTAIDTLVSLMTGNEFGGKFAVILAGYPEEMRQFLDTNPGLRSRFPQSNHLHLPDYSNSELVEIAEMLAEQNDYVITDEAKVELEKRIDMERVDETFGNARTARDILLEAIFRKGAKSESERNLLNFTLLEKEDFAASEEIDENPKEKLMDLIGLETIKEEVTSIISFVQMQQLRRERGLPSVPVQLHSVFSGNPGTGKTTVAKIYAEFLKECGMLKRGHLVVASRADFVAGYVGQTAIKTRKKIREALGGVLFIDEAYSLLSPSAGDYGKEVIDTLVDEMTKHDENLAVILAGYPNEMKSLLDSNPGLRSRFKKFFQFPDYTTEQMLEIMDVYSRGFEYHISREAKQYLKKVLDEEPVSGNGRFATNLIDEAVQVQALRMMTHYSGESVWKNATRLERADFVKALVKVRKGE